MGAHIANSEQTDRWSELEELVCEAGVRVPLPDFRVRDLLRLQSGSVLSVSRPVTQELPLEINGRQVAWCEFEVVGTHLGVRITELI
jgi:flagellar motor switch protein FliM